MTVWGQVIHATAGSGSLLCPIFCEIIPFPLGFSWLSPNPCQVGSLPLLVILINTSNKHKPYKPIQDATFGSYMLPLEKTDPCVNFVICPGETQLRSLTYSVASCNIMDIFSERSLVKWNLHS